MNIKDIKQKWQNNSENYKNHEVGSGIHDFISEMFSCGELFKLTKTVLKTQKNGIFTHDTILSKEGRPDFILYINKDVTIPVETKCYGKIERGVRQIFRYQLDYSKQYGILTDGNEWRFYRAGQYHRYFLTEILEKTDKFLTFWNDYIKPEYYYIEIFNPTVQQNLFEEKIDLNDAENRKIFFDDTTKLIANFRFKLNTDETEKKQVETAYSYLIQFILFKVIVDNGFKDFTDWYTNLFNLIGKYLHNIEDYQSILHNIRSIADYVSANIYTPFKSEQENINKKLFNNLKTNLTIDDISAWLDILAYIDKYNFGNLQNEIFGFIYENYLKDLYDDKNKGQYFTDPEVVNLMLDELGYTPKNLKNQKDKISIIDPACGAGTFLYSAVDAILRCFPEKLTENDAQKIEHLINTNIFGLDIEEFPLYLAEMSILMRLLPLIVNDNYSNPINEKIKVFKTNDSISEFLDAGIGAINPEIDYPTLFSKTDLGYQSFMRDDKNLQEMIESMQGHNGERMRFDFVVGNPPYIGYNESCKQNMPFTLKIKDKNYDSITLADVYGVNLHSVPNKIKPYAPKPNLYSFFIALALALLKKGGKMCYIIPQTMLTAKDLDVLRYHLAKNTTIEKLLTFEGNLFTGRGLQQKRPIATSSLIFVVKKEIPEKNHKVEIIKYKPYFTKQGESFKIYFKGKHRSKAKHILQSELLENVENWNFIKHDLQTLKQGEKYRKNSLSMEEFRRCVLSDYNEITLDGNFNIDNQEILDNKPQNDNFYLIPKLDKKYFSIKTFRYFDKNNFIKIAQGGQDIKLTLEKKYKIIWRYQNSNGFYFTDTENVLPNFSLYSIASDNKKLILFLFALLKSPINASLLENYLKMANEKAFLIGLSSIKQYIRIPKITLENQVIKDEIIYLTEKMLDLEKATLNDLVDFKYLMVQRFDNIEIKKNNLILIFNKKDYPCKIEKNKEEFVKKLISENFYDNCLIFNRENVTLQELKNLEAIDFDEQAKLKQKIDKLVCKMYNII